ncbi:hypothetical protein AJ80_06370 [Polytolypa hystricis UAMH7299]|uniref:Uncharacterized protein n=1 Tax=Polytolypa hystricis (strain UAMH7299) TaxID=1447883 RepID=A0A2B7XWW2_POLH7|nr:hypothetical protein AJ80_06370 [Polytolypa hystricis UAMH7299]
MTGLRKLFSVERTLFQSFSADTTRSDSCEPSSCEYSPYVGVNSSTPDPNLPRLPHMDNQTFLGIEKQFEELHDQFQSRSSRSLPPSRKFEYIDTKRDSPQPRRHVDIVEATVSTHRYRISTPFSATSIYNEDIADRNLSGPRSTRSSQYSNVISAIYQEDVADRNIVIGGGSVPPCASEEDCQSSRCDARHPRSAVTTSHTRDSKSQIRSRQYTGEHRAFSDDNRAGLRIVSSEQNLRSGPQSLKSSPGGSSQQSSIGGRRLGSLRSMSSAPTLSLLRPDSKRKSPASQPITETESPQQEAKLNVPNDSLFKITRQRSADQLLRPDNSTLNRPLPLSASSGVLFPNTTRLSARKNIRDLSVNTQLAAPNKKFVKVVAQNPPEPTVPTPRKELSATIAEIVNSPLAVSTPLGASPKPPSYNVDEMMSLFKQAYISSQIHEPHPTFETLQDAIVREINSHDAFSKIQVEPASLTSPGLSPDLTEVEEEEEESTEQKSSLSSRKASIKSISLKDRQLSKIPRKVSLRSQRRNSDVPTPVREICLPALKGMEGTGTQRRKRRHTYAQPLSLGMVHEGNGQNPSQKQVENSETARPRRLSAVPASRRPFSDVPVAEHCDIPTTEMRPRTSDSIRSRKVSGSQDKPESKLPHSRRILRSSHSTNVPIKERVTASQTDSKPKVEPPEIIFNNFKSDKVAPAIERTKSPAPSESRSLSVASQRTSSTTSSRRLFSTSPIPVGRNRIPLRRSSLHKDLFDSGRFGP